MYKQNKMTPTSITRNTSIQGESIEDKVNRIYNNNEPIKDIVPEIYTARKDGVIPAYNIRTDTWEIAVEGMGVIQKTKIAKRQERIDQQLGKKAKEGMEKEAKNEGGTQSTSGTDSK